MWCPSRFLFRFTTFHFAFYDLPLASEFLTTLFADDTYLTPSHDNLFELEKNYYSNASYK